MSHFTVLVTGDDVETALTPFDENTEVAEYIRNTKAELIEKGRKQIEEYRTGLYAEYLSDPAAYAERTNHAGHLEYLRTGFPEKLTWTDEQVYEDAIQWVEGVDSDGNELSTYNPKSKWDWWTVGGRWDLGLITKDGITCNTATVGELDLDTTSATFALLHDGQWTERGQMGWWAIVTDEKPEADWKSEWRKAVESLPPETRVTLVDVHI